MLQKGSEYLQQRLLECASVAVVYSREATQIQIDQVVIGRFHFTYENEYGITQHLRTRDFLIPAEELASLGEPMQGDRIIENGNIFEVLHIPNEPPWRWSDEFNQVFRIHAKFLKAEG